MEFEISEKQFFFWELISEHSTETVL